MSKIAQITAGTVLGLGIGSVGGHFIEVTFQKKLERKQEQRKKAALEHSKNLLTRSDIETLLKGTSTPVLRNTHEQGRYILFFSHRGKDKLNIIVSEVSEDSRGKTRYKALGILTPKQLKEQLRKIEDNYKKATEMHSAIPAPSRGQEFPKRLGDAVQKSFSQTRNASNRTCVDA